MIRTHKSPDYATWIARLAVLIVFGWNILCALQFITQPSVYIASYQLNGTAGALAIQGLGIAFLMWNVTYPLFIINPRKWSVLGPIILIQQLIGLLGESVLYFSLPSTGFTLLSQSILRFIMFDGAGALLICVSLLLLRRSTQK